jgi:hypothetical protein
MPRMGSAPRGLATGVLAACLVAGCASFSSRADSGTEFGAGACAAPVVEPGELRTVVRASYFGTKTQIVNSAALLNGSIVVAYDANPDQAGDADDIAGRVPDPGLVLVRKDGSCEPFTPPVVAGVRVADDAQPVAVGPHGALYLWDGAEHRLVRGTVDGTWETVVEIPAKRLRYTPTPGVAVSRQGDVYVATDFLVSRVAAAGKLQPVAGTGKAASNGKTYPPPDLGNFPRPGTAAPLTHLRGIAATPSGGVVMTTESVVLELDPSGTLHLLADPETTAGQEGAIEALHVDDGGVVGAGSHLTAPAVTASGDVLIGDSDRQRILRIGKGTSRVLVIGPSSINPGNALTADGRGLLVRQVGDPDLALLSLPAD